MNKKIVLTLAFSLLIIIGLISAYFLMNMINTTTRIYVNPDRIVRSANQDFTVNISIANVANLYAWECKLGWNTTILELLNVTEGSVLKETGDTFFSSRLNETFGHVVIDCTLLGDVLGASEDGVLASLQFHVKNKGSCELTLYDTQLVNASEQMITHTVNGGYFSANP